MLLVTVTRSFFGLLNNKKHENTSKSELCDVLLWRKGVVGGCGGGVGRVLSIKEGMFPEREKMGAMQQTCAVAGCRQAADCWQGRVRSPVTAELSSGAHVVDVGSGFWCLFFFCGKFQKLGAL
jgi:hypothetical protein